MVGGGNGVVNIGDGNEECKGGVGRGGAGLKRVAVPLQALVSDDTVVGGGQLIGVTLLLLKLLTLLLQQTNRSKTKTQRTNKMRTHNSLFLCLDYELWGTTFC